jgi:hypothetical protein
VLGEHVIADVNSVVRINAEYVGIERRVVDAAQGQAVGNLGEAALLPIGNDMRGVEQLPMAESADTATAIVRAYNQLTESSLV